MIYKLQFDTTIRRHQRNKLKLDNLSLGTSPERVRPLRHQHSTDNMHATGNFNIPYVKVEQRKTCSEENMIKTHHSSSKLRLANRQSGNNRRGSRETRIKTRERDRSIRRFLIIFVISWDSRQRERERLFIIHL